MPRLTRSQRKEDFDHVMSMLEIDPEDDAHKLLMKVTKSGIRDINTLLSEKKDYLTTLESKDADGNTLTLDKWEASEMINIGRYENRKHAEIG